MDNIHIVDFSYGLNNNQLLGKELKVTFVYRDTQIRKTIQVKVSNKNNDEVKETLESIIKELIIGIEKKTGAN